MVAYISILDNLNVDIDKLAKEKYVNLIQMLEAGISPQQALESIYLSFSKGFIPEYAALMAGAFTQLLQKPFTPTQMLEYPVGKLSLSSKIYVNAKEVAQEAKQIIENHLKGFIDLRKLALDLYSGYDINPASQEVLQAKKVLPKYLKEAVGEFAGEVDRQIAKLIASDLKTPALRAAYLQLIDKVEKEAGKKALDNALRSATAEKMRYYANRMAQTEAVRAFNKQQAKKIQGRDDVEWVQVRYSGAHTYDYCNLFGDPDRYGMGQGVYPKDEAPVAPFHPHCRCKLVVRLDLQANPDAKLDVNAERAYLDSLSDEEAKGILPAGARKYIEDGGDLRDYLNSRSGKDYQIPLLGDV